MPLEVPASAFVLLCQVVFSLEKKNQALLAQVQQLTEQIQTLLASQQSQLQQLQQEQTQLKQQITKKNRKLFGKSSERRLAPKDPPPKGEKASQKGHGPREQTRLPLVEEIHRLDEADQVCPECGGQLQEWSHQFEESDEITVIARRYVVKRHKRQKYRCRCGRCIEVALGPVKLQEGGHYAINFATEVAVDKYGYHLPLARQVQMMLHQGLKVDTQTLWDQIERLARLLEPAYRALKEYLLQQDLLGADETKWHLLIEKEGAPKKTWRVWAIVSPQGVYYQIEDSRSEEAAKKLLEDYQGLLMVDGYISYEALLKQNPKLVLVNCWAHVRRYFIEIEKAFPVESKKMVDWIRDLYEINRKYREASDQGEEQQEQRRRELKALLAEIKKWAEEQTPLPKSGLFEAINYMLNHWEGLTRFVDDPRIPLDNNATERALRSVVVGRKNHYGSKSKRGTEVAALLYSLIESAKLVGIDPKEYLNAATQAALTGQAIPLPHTLAATRALDSPRTLQASESFEASASPI